MQKRGQHLQEGIEWVCENAASTQILQALSRV